MIIRYNRGKYCPENNSYKGRDMSAPKVVVFGYHDIGYACLEALLDADVNVVAVFTHDDQPDKEVIWFRSVRDLATSHHIPVYSPAHPNDPETFSLLKTIAPDLIFSFNYRRLVGDDILQLATLGAFNMHSSYLPAYRGRVPVHWAILNNEKKIGATLHHMVLEFDAGDIVDQEAVAIGENDTSKNVLEKVTLAARAIVERQLSNLLSGNAPRFPQDEKLASYFGGRTYEDGLIDWKQGAQQVFNLIRASTHPYPGAFSHVKGRRFYVWWAKPVIQQLETQPGEVISDNPLRIATLDGYLEVLQYQWQDSPMSKDPRLHGLSCGQLLGVESE